ncbi:hypothetical protein HPULCUR_010997 [Helicostylum pulchrum]|uniref:Uncharacterized protein n=1 Tax=Helicostylum pulchrum TaxID=562976 RepID=A0ABP9YEV6_9FUNG
MDAWMRYVVMLSLCQEESIFHELYDLYVNTSHPPIGNAAGNSGLDLDGAHDGIRPVQNSFVHGCLICHVWVIDPYLEERPL